MSKTAAIPMDKEIQSFQFIFTGQQYFSNTFLYRIYCKNKEDVSILTHPHVSVKKYGRFWEKNNR